jgi:hypothetical protein
MKLLNNLFISYKTNNNYMKMQAVELFNLENQHKILKQAEVLVLVEIIQILTLLQVQITLVISRRNHH